MNKKSILLGVSSLALTALAFTPSLIKAYQGDPSVQGPNCTPERHEAMEQAFANNDYATWQSLMQGRGRVKDLINEGNFAQFSQAHQLAAEGKVEEANQIRTELGLGLRNGSGKGQGQGYGRTNR